MCTDRQTDRQTHNRQPDPGAVSLLALQLERVKFCATDSTLLGAFPLADDLAAVQTVRQQFAAAHPVPVVVLLLLLLLLLFLAIALFFRPFAATTAALPCAGRR